MFVTSDILNQYSACYAGVEKFNEKYPKGVELWQLIEDCLVPPSGNPEDADVGAAMWLIDRMPPDNNLIKLDSLCTKQHRVFATSLEVFGDVELGGDLYVLGNLTVHGNLLGVKGVTVGGDVLVEGVTDVRNLVISSTGKFMRDVFCEKTIYCEWDFRAYADVFVKRNLITTRNIRAVGNINCSGEIIAGYLKKSRELPSSIWAKTKPANISDGARCVYEGVWKLED